MNIQDLPTELQNKIFYYAAEHPCAKMIKKIHYNYIYKEEQKYNCNYFKISNNKSIIKDQNPECERYWNNLIIMIDRRKKICRNIR